MIPRQNIICTHGGHNKTEHEHSESAYLRQGESCADPESGVRTPDPVDFKHLIRSYLSRDTSVVTFSRRSGISNFCVELLTDRQTNKQTDKQTDKRRALHNLLGGGSDMMSNPNKAARVTAKASRVSRRHYSDVTTSRCIVTVIQRYR